MSGHFSNLVDLNSVPVHHSEDDNVRENSEKFRVSASVEMHDLNLNDRSENFPASASPEMHDLGSNDHAETNKESLGEGKREEMESGKPSVGFEIGKASVGVESDGELSVSTAELSEGENNTDNQNGSNENSFSVGDMVWAKVKYHPWWPGMVFNASYASDAALKRRKKHSVLIANFGDQTFSWCQMSCLKPFKENLQDMIQHSFSKTLHGALHQALNEYERRVDFGLSCPCYSAKRIKLRPIINAGIREGVVISHQKESSLALSQFKPSSLLSYIRELAQSPVVNDLLRISTVRAQLSALNATRSLLASAKISAEISLKHSKAYKASSSILSGKTMHRVSPKRKEGKEDETPSRKRGRKKKTVKSSEEIGEAEAETEHYSEDHFGIAKTQSQNVKKKISKPPRTPKTVPRQRRKDYFLARHLSFSTPSRPKRNKVFASDSLRKKDSNSDVKTTPKVSKLGECLSKIAFKVIGSSPLTPLDPNNCPGLEREGMLQRSSSNEDLSSEDKNDLLQDIRNCSVKELLLKLFLVAQDPTNVTNVKVHRSILSRVTKALLKFRDAAFQQSLGHQMSDSSPKKTVCSSASDPENCNLVNSKDKKGKHRKRKIVGCSEGSKKKLCTRQSNACVAERDSESNDKVEAQNETDSREADNATLNDEEITSDHVGDQNEKVEKQVEEGKMDKKLEGTREMMQNQVSFKEDLKAGETPTISRMNVNEKSDPVTESTDKSPTALFMTFPSGFSVPTESDLKDKFVRYGEVTQVVLFEDSGCAQVIFKSHLHAERAFHNATADGVFGSVTIPFRLRYLSSV